MNTERKFAVSTDSSGLLGSPKTWKAVWGFLENDSKFAGFEIIGWRWITLLVAAAPKEGIKVTGIHGRFGEACYQTSLPARILHEMVNQTLVDTPVLVKRYGQAEGVDYILVHASELRSPDNLKVLKSHPPKLLYLENHIGVGAEGQAVSGACRLREMGIATGVMFDLAHFFHSYGWLNNGRDEFVRGWDTSLEYLRKIAAETGSENVKLGLHLPIGPNRNDSLPVEEMPEEMWHNLAEIIRNLRINHLVLENNQPFSSGSLYLTRPQIAGQRERNIQVVEILRQAGVL